MGSLNSFRLLLITDGYDASTAERVGDALAALPRGVAAVQLRAKSLGGRAMLEATLALGEVVRQFAAPLVINDRFDVALAAGAEGVHLPSNALPAKVARRAVGQRLMIGCSTHSLEEARMAARGGADYVTFGPVFPTASKAAFGAPLGVEALREVVAALSIPVFALGGVDSSTARACVEAGARIACIGQVLGRSSTASGARALWEAMA